MPIRVRARAVAVGLVAVSLLAVGACGGDDDDAPEPRGPNPTSSDPGPNPTGSDPGPNPTDEGPVTIDGTLQVTAECVTLQRPDGPRDLRLDGYEAKGDTLVGDDGNVAARSGQRIVVAGNETDETGPCGRRFDDAGLVTVLPE
jgi:hypothetical protein